MRHVMVGVPCHTGEVTVPFCQSLYAEGFRALKEGIALVPFFYCGGSILPLARNGMLSECLSGDYTDVVFIDADEGWESGAVCRLLSHPVDLVGGSVRLKKEPEQYAVRWLDQPELWADSSGLIEVAGLGTGFLRVSRRAVESLVAAHPELEYADGDCTSGKAWALFDTGLHEGRYYGEDMHFCRLARDRGLRIYLDPELEFSHTGPKTYTGSIGRWLKSRSTPNPQE